MRRDKSFPWMAADWPGASPTRSCPVIAGGRLPRDISAWSSKYFGMRHTPHLYVARWFERPDGSADGSASEFD